MQILTFFGAIALVWVGYAAIYFMLCIAAAFMGRGGSSRCRC